ncbi:MAG: gliding motility-associated C-terminal domain-containing protein [Saprospiraceae bacterium]|nr:gliding motility-associated C-terminal domain-containing protein [Saprospiraceae bacterium]
MNSTTPRISSNWLIKTLKVAAITLIAAPATAQLTVTLNITDATCTSNGKIEVIVTGGSGSYNYQLFSPCPTDTFLQLSNVFNNLEPCNYTLIVNDGPMEETETLDLVVGGNYQSPVLTLNCSPCSIEANVENGTAPFSYSISNAGLQGPFAMNIPPSNPIFTNLVPGQNYWVQVQDSCSNTTTVQCQTPLSNLDCFGTLDTAQLTVHALGGSPPFEYTLTSAAGSFSNATGIFPLSELGCDAFITVADGCSEKTEEFEQNPYLLSVCPNFSAGTAEVQVVATPPFTITCGTPSGNFTSYTGSFTGLPLQAAYYNFRVTDGCGKTSNTTWRYRPGPAFPQGATSCQDSTLELSTFFGHCQPGFHVQSHPIYVECLSCPDSTTVVLGQQGGPSSAVLDGVPLGDWELSFGNACGDTIICHDSLVLDVQAYCDSIHAQVADRFYCNNQTYSDRALAQDSAFFYLLDSLGNLLDSNATGAFAGLMPGNYSVKAKLPGCGEFEATTYVGTYLTVNFNFTASISSQLINGHCTPVYRLRLTSSYGELHIWGNGVDRVLDEDDLDANCLQYYTDLLPGEYAIQAMRYCGIPDSIFLPMPTFNLEAVADGTCPGGGTVTATGALDVNEWEAWADSNNLNIDWGSYATDRYRLDLAISQNQTGTTYTFNNVPPGDHTVYLLAFFGNCPLDTTTVTVPVPVPLSMNTGKTILCDGAATLDLDLQIAGGKLPYMVQEVDCNNFLTVLNSTTSYDTTVILPGLEQGDHCFRVVDACLNSVDKQLSIGYYQDSITVNYNCDNTVTLQLDNVPATYTWKNGAGDVLGHTRELIVQNPMDTVVYEAFIDIGACILERSIALSPAQIVPSVSISGENRLCGVDTLVLTVVTDAPQFLWNNGLADAQVQIFQPGIYSVSATSDYGCTTTASMQVAQVPELNPVINGDPSICPGQSNWLWVEGTFDEIQWSNGVQGDSLLANMPISLVVTVVDTFGCAWEGSVSVTEHLPPAPVIVGDTVICKNETTSLSLGQPYTAYTWSDGSATPVMVGAAGSYSVTITDANGCTGTDSTTIVETPQIVVHLSGDTLLCRGDTATLSVGFSNATNTLLLWWNTPVLPSPTVVSQDTTFLFIATQDMNVSLLSAEQAGYDCPFSFPDTVGIRTGRAALSIEVPQPFNGYPVSCYGMADGSAEAQATEGIPPFSFLWSNLAQTPAIHNLPAGMYAVTVTDSLGCRAEDSVFLVQPLPLVPALLIEPPRCHGEDNGRVEVITWTGGAGEAEASINGDFTVLAPALFEGMPPGAYGFTLEDENGCRYDTAFIFPSLPELFIDLGADVGLALGDQERLNPQLNFMPDSLVWSPPTWLDDPDDLRPNTMPYEDVEYTLTAWNEHGCPASDAVLVRVDKSLAVYAPNAFSPNGDGINDGFTLFAKTTAMMAIRSLRVFDRWGGMVFFKEDFPFNEPAEGWDGQFNGHPVAPAVFTWWAEVETVDGRVEMMSGDLTLVR